MIWTRIEVSHHIRLDKDRRAERKGREKRKGRGEEERGGGSQVQCIVIEHSVWKIKEFMLRTKNKAWEEHYVNTQGNPGVHTHKNQQVKNHRQRLTIREGRSAECVQRMEVVLILHIKTLAVVYQGLITMHFGNMMVYSNATILKMISFFFPRVTWSYHIQWNLSQNVFAIIFCINDYYWQNDNSQPYWNILAHFLNSLCILISIIKSLKLTHF